MKNEKIVIHSNKQLIDNISLPLVQNEELLLLLLLI